MPFTGAALCSRAAVLTTSPDAMPSPASGLGVETDERLSRRDPDPQLEILLERELADRERGADGALGIVLVRGRCSEERHDRVADELLHGAAVALELCPDALVVRAEECLDVFGIHRLGACGEADEVAEDDRDDLALAPRVGHQAILARSASPRSMKRTAPAER